MVVNASAWFIVISPCVEFLTLVSTKVDVGTAQVYLRLLCRFRLAVLLSRTLRRVHLRVFRCDKQGRGQSCSKIHPVHFGYETQCGGSKDQSAFRNCGNGIYRALTPLCKVLHTPLEEV